MTGKTIAGATTAPTANKQRALPAGPRLRSRPAAAGCGAAGWAPRRLPACRQTPAGLPRGPARLHADRRARRRLRQGPRAGINSQPCGSQAGHAQPALAVVAGRGRTVQPRSPARGLPAQSAHPLRRAARPRTSASLGACPARASPAPRPAAGGGTPRPRAQAGRQHRHAALARPTVPQSPGTRQASEKCEQQGKRLSPNGTRCPQAASAARGLAAVGGAHQNRLQAVAVAQRAQQEAVVGAHVGGQASQRGQRGDALRHAVVAPCPRSCQHRVASVLQVQHCAGGGRLPSLAAADAVAAAAAAAGGGHAAGQLWPWLTTAVAAAAAVAAAPRQRHLHRQHSGESI